MPRARHEYRAESTNHPAFKQNGDKPRDGRYKKDSKTVHEREDLQEDTDEECEDDKNEVFLQDGGLSEDTQEDGDLENEQEEPGGEEFMETFVAAWRAKKKTNEHRLSRGFAPKGSWKIYVCAKQPVEGRRFLYFKFGSPKGL